MFRPVVGWLVLTLSFFAFACEQRPQPPAAECGDHRTENGCKQCCLTHGTSRYIFEIAPDEGPMCKCVEPASEPASES